VLDAGNVFGIISAMASGNAMGLVNVEQQRIVGREGNISEVRAMSHHFRNGS
jgi:hypothetical protein